MKIFQRITFPTSAIYNVQTEIGAKIIGSADVEVLESPIKLVCVDASDLTVDEALAVIEDYKNSVKKPLQIA